MTSPLLLALLDRKPDAWRFYETKFGEYTYLDAPNAHRLCEPLFTMATIKAVEAELEQAAAHTQSYCCIESYRAARALAWKKIVVTCDCDPHSEYCDICVPPEFRSGGAWDQRKPLMV